MDVLLHVPSKSQLPALPNSCEVTGLVMPLAAVGQPVDKMTLVRNVPADLIPAIFRPGRGNAASADGIE